MVSNFDDKSLRCAVSEGKRHYHVQKKTSLYGSESPKKEKGFHHKPRFGNPDNILGSTEEVLIQNNILNNSKTQSTYQEKRATLEELQRYNPWGKPGAGAPNVNHPTTSNRAKWEMEEDMKARENVNGNTNNQFPGFSAGFGAGNSQTNSRRQSEFSQASDPRQNSYLPYGNTGETEHSLRTNQQESMNEEESDEMYRKYKQTKELADNLDLCNSEKEIQQLKLRQLEDKYASMQEEKNREYAYNADHENMDHSYPNYHEDTDDALSREAENRARLRELVRLKESHEHGLESGDSNSFIDQKNLDKIRMVENSNTNGEFEPHGLRRHLNNQKNSSTNNRNDYRPYTVEEYMNCKPQMINPTLNKRTTLSGSEERTNFNNANDYNDNKNNNNSNLQMIDEDSLIHKFSKSNGTANTHDHLFPSDRNYSPIKSSLSYQTKAPYATD